MHAVTDTSDKAWIGLYYDREGKPTMDSPSGAHPDALKRLATKLPQVCRQIHAETSAFIYTANTFGFASELGALKWLMERSQAQELVIRSIVLPKDEDLWFEEVVKIMCPNFREVEFNDDILSEIGPTPVAQSSDDED